MSKKIILLAVTVALIIASCNKPEGEGGQATIQGKIWVENYNTLGSISSPPYFLKGEF